MKKFKPFTKRKKVGRPFKHGPFRRFLKRLFGWK